MNPDALSLALGNLYTGFLAIVAALRIKFARAVALGASIGEIVGKPASRYISPLISMMLPKDYKKWANPTVSKKSREKAVTHTRLKLASIIYVWSKQLFKWPLSSFPLFVCDECRFYLSSNSLPFRWLGTFNVSSLQSIQLSEEDSSLLGT